jgi:hypothetical protein
MSIRKFAPTLRLLTHVAHSLMQPAQCAVRKARLRDFGLRPGATLPVIRLDPRMGCSCADPGCEHLIADAQRFHRPNAPRQGLMRWLAPSAMLLDLSKFQSGDAYVQVAHGDYLKTDAMKLLFLEVARWLVDKQASEARGVSWFMYGALEHGGRGLHQWKRLFCFEPATFTMKS